MVVPSTSRYAYSGPPRSRGAATPSYSQTTTPAPAATDPTLEAVQAVADRLETGLTTSALSAITDLLRAGVHPDTVVAIVSSLAQVPR